MPGRSARRSPAAVVQRVVCWNRIRVNLCVVRGSDRRSHAWSADDLRAKSGHNSELECGRTSVRIVRLLVSLKPRGIIGHGLRGQGVERCGDFFDRADSAQKIPPKPAIPSGSCSILGHDQRALEVRLACVSSLVEGNSRSAGADNFGQHDVRVCCALSAEVPAQHSMAARSS